MIGIFQALVMLVLVCFVGVGCSSTRINAPGGSLDSFRSGIYNRTEINMPQEALDRCQMNRTQQQWNQLQMARFARDNGIWFQIPWSVDNDAYCRQWMQQQFGGGLQFGNGFFGFPSMGFGGFGMVPATASPLMADFTMGRGFYASPSPVYLNNAPQGAPVPALMGQITLQQYLGSIQSRVNQNTQDIDAVGQGVSDLYRRRR